MSRTSSAKTDFFAEIATQKEVVRDANLIEPGPPELPPTDLPSTRHDPEAVFRPQPKLDDAEKLSAELKRSRKHYAKYLRDLAPAAKIQRPSVELKSAAWRLETEDDQQAFTQVLDGEGQWDRVNIPHYGGPTGRQTAYYRFQFNLEDSIFDPGRLFVCFRAVDYKAQVFVNGTFLGSHEGFFAPFSFDFSACAQRGTNTLVVKVENDHICKGHQAGADNGNSEILDGDKIYAATGLGWDDPQQGWHHCPPGMGICQGVSIEARPPLFIDDLFIRPIPEEARAEIWLEVYNTQNRNVPVDLRVSVYGQNFRKTMLRDAVFEIGEPEARPAGPGLNYYRTSIPMPDFQWWEPSTPWLYQAQISLRDADEKPVDVRCRQFGMRSFQMEEQEKPYGRLYLNGRSIRLRGANTMGHEQQCVFKGDFDQLLDDLLLAKLANMNFLRLTQRPVESEVYDLCDRIGLMTQTDLPLFAVLRRNQFWEAVRQSGEMEKLIRSHPCNVIISYFNEPFPAGWPLGKKIQRHLTRPEVESFFECANRLVWLHNPDRVIKPIDGDYDPPGPLLPDNHCYNGWYNGHGLDLGKLHRGYWQKVKPDWLYGCGEFGAEGLEDAQLMRRHYPKHWLPQSTEEEATWNPTSIVQAQTGPLHYLWMDGQDCLEDWIAASQAHQAWATRMQTAAFRRDARMVTFAIHLFIDAFPAGWMKTIMDSERRPKPAYFEYRDLLTPLMVNLRTDRYTYFGGETTEIEAWVCNDTHDIPGNARLCYQLELNGEVVCAQRAPARIEADTSCCQGRIRFKLPKVKTRSQAVIRLALDIDGKQHHHCEETLTLFPDPVGEITPATVRLRVVTQRKNSPAKQLLQELGLPVKKGGAYSSADTILVDTWDAFEARRDSILHAVEQGARLIFLDLEPIGNLEIGTIQLTLETCRMGARHFVSRKTEHPSVAGFRENDFRFWHEPKQDRVTPLLTTLILTQDPQVIPILKTGQTGWGEAGQSAFAACEWAWGAGRVTFCQVALAGRVQTNPVARIFSCRLLAGL